MFLGISSGTGTARIRLKGLLPALKRLQNVAKSTLDPGKIGLTISSDAALKHLRIFSYLSFCMWNPNRLDTAAWSIQIHN
jgi:hypothetical protein